MNANELADELQELDSKLHLINLFKAATMLRQQQAEIEALKAKTLTDEEIGEVTNTIEWRGSDWLWELDFAKAILRKAQENV